LTENIEYKYKKQVVKKFHWQDQKNKSEHLYYATCSAILYFLLNLLPVWEGNTVNFGLRPQVDTGTEAHICRDMAQNSTFRTLPTVSPLRIVLLRWREFATQSVAVFF